MEIGLVSCTKSKRDSPAVPRRLYDASALFRKASTYCERHHDEWYVLSAKFGLLEPDGQKISPYDKALIDVTVDERREWATRVAEQLDNAGLLTEGTVLVVHAGKAYYEQLLPLVELEVTEVQIPTKGLAIGETLAWYDEQY